MINGKGMFHWWISWHFRTLIQSTLLICFLLTSRCHSVSTFHLDYQDLLLQDSYKLTVKKMFPVNEDKFSVRRKNDGYLTDNFSVRRKSLLQNHPKNDGGYLTFERNNISFENSSSISDIYFPLKNYDYSLQYDRKSSTETVLPYKTIISPFKNVYSPLYHIPNYLSGEKIISKRKKKKKKKKKKRHFTNEYLGDDPHNIKHKISIKRSMPDISKTIEIRSGFPHLSNPNDITSFEMPSKQKEIYSNRKTISEPIIVEEISKERRTPYIRKVSRIYSVNKDKQRPTSNSKKVMKTLITTPKRIIGSPQGMGGSAVKPSGHITQHFATQPAPQTAVVGSTAVLPCRVMGKVGHLQWTKDGFGMGTDRDLFGFSRYAMIGDDDEGDFSLRIQPVLLEDDALFQCQVSAIDGIPGIRSKPVRLTVYVPPDPPRVSPPVLETTAGTTVTLQCMSIGGRPPPEIQWVDDSRRETIADGSVILSELMEDKRRSIVTSKLSFTPFRYHDNHTITCITSNQALSSPLTSSISLSVMFAPEISLSSQPNKIIEGDDVEFFCEAQANPSLVSYRWFLNGLPLINKTQRTLHLEKISRTLHKNIISCEVSNKVGSSKKDMTLTIRYGPSFRTIPRDIMSEVGQQATLKCNVDSNPEASIVWLRDGSNKIIGSGPSLTIRVNSTSAGVYKCIAGIRGPDFEFPELTGNVKLLLKGPPTIVSESEQQGRLGDTVSVICSTVSVPSPIKVTWTYKGREIDLNNPRYEVVEDENSEKTRNILVIHDSASSDFGSYNCSVVNEYGVARKLITLQPEKRIPLMIVVGGILTFVVIIVIILSLVLCNKKHSTIKGTANEIQSNNYCLAEQKEKEPPDIMPAKDSFNTFEIREEKSRLDDVTRHVNPESGILKNSTLNSNRHTVVDNRHLSLDNRYNSLDNRYYSMERRKSYQLEGVGGSSILHSSSGDLVTKVQNDTLQVRFEDNYLSSRSRSQTNVNFAMEELGKRTSTQSSLLTTSPQKYSDNIPAGYSSLRRTPHSYTVQPRTTHHLPPRHTAGINGTPNLSLSKSGLISNGSALPYSTPPKRSPYSPSSGSWSPTPLPPPYQRNSIPNGRPVGLCESPRPASRMNSSLSRNVNTKVQYTAGSKVMSGATYL